MILRHRYENTNSGDSGTKPTGGETPSADQGTGNGDGNGTGTGIGSGTSGGVSGNAGSGSTGQGTGETVGLTSAALLKSSGTEQVIAPSEEENPDQEQVKLPDTTPKPSQNDKKEDEQKKENNLAKTETPQQRQWTFVLIALLGTALAAGVIRYIVYLVQKKTREKTGDKR